MDIIKYFKDLFESTPDYRKVVLLMFLIKNNNDLLTECGFLKEDTDRLCKKFKYIILEQNEEYSDYIKNEEESEIEKFLNK